MLGRCRLGYNIISLTMLVIKQKAKRWLSRQYIAYTDRHSFSRPRDITSTVQRQCVKAAHGSSQYPKSQTVMQSHSRESKDSRSLVSRLGNYFISSSQPPTQRQRRLSSTHQLRVVYLYTGRTSSINSPASMDDWMKGRPKRCPLTNTALGGHFQRRLERFLAQIEKSPLIYLL